MEAIVSAFECHHGRAARRAGLVLIIALGNLRGIRESGHGLLDRPTASSSSSAAPSSPAAGPPRRRPEHLRHRAQSLDVHVEASLTQFLILRAFAQGCTALTGVEAISNGVSAFKRESLPRRHHDGGHGPHHLGALFLGTLLATISATHLSTATKEAI
ncbi:MAG: hypothetical protein U0547_07125 [Dehalococcoidia bacterium]